MFAGMQLFQSSKFTLPSFLQSKLQHSTIMIYYKYNVLEKMMPNETNKTKINKPMWRKELFFAKDLLSTGFTLSRRRQQ